MWGYGLREKAEIGCALTPDGQFFQADPDYSGPNDNWPGW